ncbi:hypothetical protein EDC04DRAFT_3095010 [Pisolithus marmoratus]|nr:hypothetical protein EDC04DRAFT_3095010 [Pisolithus marmoratus]
MSPSLQVMQQNTCATLHSHRENHCVQHSPKCQVPDPPQCFVIVILLFSIIMLLSLAAVIDIADWLLPPNSLLGVTVIISWGALVREDIWQSTLGNGCGCGNVVGETFVALGPGFPLMVFMSSGAQWL